MKTIVKMTRSETVQAGALIMAHCVKGPDGLCDYEEGWDDERVHGEVGVKTTIHAVGNLRLELLGKLRNTRSLNRLAAVNSAVTLAEALRPVLERLDVLEAWAAARPVVPFGKKRSIKWLIERISLTSMGPCRSFSI